MKIELQNEDKIVVELSSHDLQTLDITYEDMDYANIETRRVIWTLLDEARRVLGKDISTTERMLIEALPSEDGGCVLYFTVLPSAGREPNGKRLVMKKEAEPMLLFLRDSDGLIETAEELKELMSHHKGFSSYAFDGAYYIIVYPKLTQSEYLLRRLCEYCDVSDAESEQFARITEYGRLLSSFSERGDGSLTVGGAENIAAGNQHVGS